MKEKKKKKSSNWRYYTFRSYKSSFMTFSGVIVPKPSSLGEFVTIPFLLSHCRWYYMVFPDLYCFSNWACLVARVKPGDSWALCIAAGRSINRQRTIPRVGDESNNNFLKVKHKPQQSTVVQVCTSSMLCIHVNSENCSSQNLTLNLSKLLPIQVKLSPSVLF